MIWWIGCFVVAIHQLARCSIRFAGVKVNAAGKPDGPADRLCHFGDSDV